MPAPLCLIPREWHFRQLLKTKFPLRIDDERRFVDRLENRPMKNWTTKEAKLAMDWARTPVECRPQVSELANRLGRTSAAVQEFLRRMLPPGQRPWAEKPRWAPAEIDALKHSDGTVPTRSRAAVKKYKQRHASDEDRFDEAERASLTVSQVASDLGLSRATVYRLLKNGALRRFKGRVAESSFNDLLREHPEIVPYSRLPRDQKEWLVLNGYFDPSMSIKRPSTQGLLD